MGKQARPCAMNYDLQNEAFDGEKRFDQSVHSGPQVHALEMQDELQDLRAQTLRRLRQRL